MKKFYLLVLGYVMGEMIFSTIHIKAYDVVKEDDHPECKTDDDCPLGAECDEGSCHCWAFDCCSDEDCDQGEGEYCDEDAHECDN